MKQIFTLCLLAFISIAALNAQTAPTIGLTSFSGIANNTYFNAGGATGTTSGSTVANVNSKGWDFQVFATTSVVVRANNGVLSALGGTDASILCGRIPSSNQASQTTTEVRVRANNAMSFKLKSISIASNNLQNTSAISYFVTMTGYKSGSLVTGAIVTTNTLSTNNVFQSLNTNSNIAFNNIDELRFTTTVATGAVGAIFIDEINIDNAVSNTSPIFTNATTTLSICQNAAATSINSLLQVTDADASQTETFSITGNPNHGTITTGTTVASGTDVSPTGWSYTPDNDYSGTDAFTVKVDDANGGNTTKTITVTVNAATYNVTTQTASGSYSWNGNNYTSSGTYTYSYNNASGCASVDTLNLTITTPTISVNNLGTSFTSFKSCAPFGSDIQDILVSGTDLTGDITITAPTGFLISRSSPINFTNSITLTQSSGIVSSTRIHAILQATIPQTYSGNISISSPGAIQIDMPVTGIVSELPDLSVTSSTVKACIGSATASFSYAANAGSPNQYAMDWSNLAYSAGFNDINFTTLGTSPQSFPIPSNAPAGSYKGNLYIQNSVTGCVMPTSIDITVNIVAPTSSTSNLTILDTQLPYSWNGLTFNAAGTQTAHLTNTAGCDSAATLNLTVTAACVPTTSTTTVAICPSLAPYHFNGNDYFTTGSYLVHLTNAGGCDSAATLNLTVYQIISTYAYDTICSNQLPYVWHGLTFTSAGSKPLFLTSATGCDSVVTLVLAVKQATSSSSNASVYATQLPYSWNGLTFNAAGTQTAHLTNKVGCDSAATLTLSITPPACIPTASTTSVSVCTSALPYNWNGLTFNAAGTQTAHLTNAGGCDSAATLTVTTKASPSITSITNGTVNISTATLCSLGSTTPYFNATPYGVWSSSNVAVASVTGGSQSGVVTANSNGTATIKYTVSNSIGCSSSASLLVTVAQQATPNAITGTSSACAGSTIALTSSTIGGVWSSLNDKGTINANSGIYTAANAGGGQVKYTVTNASGCSAFTTKSITVNAIPAVPTITYTAVSANNRQLFTYGSNFCNGKSFGVVGIPSGGSWAYTNPLVGTITSGGVVSLIGVGSGSIVYTYTDVNGCSSSRTMAGNVANCPIPKGATINNEQLAMGNDFTMYPNPARSLISLNVETLVGAGSIVVTDLYGKLVKTQSLSLGTNNVNIANLSKGFYLVSVITSEGKTTKKLIVE